MFVGSFEGDFVQFQTDTVSAFNKFQAEGVSRLIIDLTDNGGGFVCLGLFLHNYLAGANFGYPGFQSTIRANALAQRILGNDIKLNTTDNLSFYTADNCTCMSIRLLIRSLIVLCRGIPAEQYPGACLAQLHDTTCHNHSEWCTGKQQSAVLRRLHTLRCRSPGKGAFRL